MQPPDPPLAAVVVEVEPPLPTVVEAVELVPPELVEVSELVTVASMTVLEHAASSGIAAYWSLRIAHGKARHIPSRIRGAARCCSDRVDAFCLIAAEAVPIFVTARHRLLGHGVVRARALRRVLTGSVFDGANLRGCDFFGAELTAARFCEGTTALAENAARAWIVRHAARRPGLAGSRSALSSGSPSCPSRSSPVRCAASSRPSCSM
jgi:hypothetical protein